MPVTQAFAVPAFIEKARVLDVDSRFYLLSVITEFTHKPLSGIPFATPYQHFINGEGIYFLPEVGSLCWLCTPSDGSMPFVLAWASAASDGDFRAMKQELNPGDIYLGTRDENFLVLRRGGVVQIGATPLAQRIFLPINNTIRDFCENYELHTIGGDLTWSVDVSEKTSSGMRPTLLSLSAREYAEDEDAIATLEIGSHDGDPNAILTLEIKESGDSGASSVLTLKLSKDGSVSWMASGKVAWEFKDDFMMSVTGNATISSKKTAKLSGVVSAEIEGGLVKVTSKTGVVAVSAAGGMAVSTPGGGPAMKIGKGSAPGMRATKSTLAWLQNHTHLVPALSNSPTTGAQEPFPADAASKDLLTS
jgi:hypothetical protein